jgi:hypothetical protein
MGAGALNHPKRRFPARAAVDAPEFAWAEACNASATRQQGWGYDAAARRLRWGHGLCLDASGVGTSLSLLPCGAPSGVGAQVRKTPNFSFFSLASFGPT